MIMCDCKNIKRKDWTKIHEELNEILKPFLKKHDMTLEKVYWSGSYSNGDIEFVSYGHSEHVPRYEVIK